MWIQCLASLWHKLVSLLFSAAIVLIWISIYFDSDRWKRCNMGRNRPMSDSRKPKSQLSCHKTTCISGLDSSTGKKTNKKPLNHQPSTGKALMWSPTVVCCFRLLHLELSPQWRVCERRPCRPPWLTHQTRPAGRRPLGSKGHTQLPATSYERRSSDGVECDPPRPWVASSSSTLLWKVQSSRSGSTCRTNNKNCEMKSTIAAAVGTLMRESAHLTQWTTGFSEITAFLHSSIKEQPKKGQMFKKN